ncbi:MAG: hypothetical protein U9P10_08575 [Thermodesulfobacteriota bacterium]|nr:hypothetical protein [Thermodesulfobacteriota bacterium]
MGIYCLRKEKHAEVEACCRTCIYRKRCRAYQLWLQPELPFVFKDNGSKDSVLDIQNRVKNTLDSLFPSEYKILQKKALKRLSKAEDKNAPLVRLKMYELLQKS